MGSVLLIVGQTTTPSVRMTLAYKGHCILYPWHSMHLRQQQKHTRLSRGERDMLSRAVAMTLTAVLSYWAYDMPA